ncbi:hypothetical protein D3C80_538250 [compost metagenome]
MQAVDRSRSQAHNTNRGPRFGIDIFETGFLFRLRRRRRFTRGAFVLLFTVDHVEPPEVTSANRGFFLAFKLRGHFHVRALNAFLWFFWIGRVEVDRVTRNAYNTFFFTLATGPQLDPHLADVQRHDRQNTESEILVFRQLDDIDHVIQFQCIVSAFGFNRVKTLEGRTHENSSLFMSSE